MKRACNSIQFPRNERETSIALEKFSKICRILQVIGAIDARHVEVVAPENAPIDYFCRKQKFTISTQSVVDGNLKFIDVSTGFPGSIHDARVLRASSLYHTAGMGDILNSRQTMRKIACIMLYTILLRDQSFITLGTGAGWNLQNAQKFCTPSIFVLKFSYPIEK